MLALISFPAHAQAPIGLAFPPQIIDVEEVATKTAETYNLPVKKFNAVIRCESNWDVGAVGDSGHARGLVQINDLYNASITPQEAFDPVFATKFMAEEWSVGHENHWSCFRIEQSRNWK